MPEQPFSDLIPSEDEIRQILAQTMKDNPSRYPAVVLQIEIARSMANFIGKLNEALLESIKQLRNTIYGNK